MQMMRRSNVMKGLVKFPVDRIPNGHEGGTVVRLVVIPSDDDMPVCCGGFCQIEMDEVFYCDDGDDAMEVEKSISIGDDEFPTEYRYEKRHFPGYHVDDPERNYHSIPYLAVILMGSTGWNCAAWICTYDDLTTEGKKLYDMIQQAYPSSKLYLQTWIDT